MMEDVWEWFLFKPSRIFNLGKTILCFGFILLISGLLGKAAIAAANMPWVHGAVGGSKALAEIYPDIPTWWVPESPFGLCMAIALIAVGFILAVQGKKYMRIVGEHDW